MVDDAGFAFHQAQSHLGTDGQAGGVSVGIEAHVVVGLAHPGECGTVLDFDGIAPEAGENLSINGGKRVCIHGASLLHYVIDFALIRGFQEMSYKVVVIGLGDHLGQHPATLTFVIAGLL